MDNQMSSVGEEKNKRAKEISVSPCVESEQKYLTKRDNKLNEALSQLDEKYKKRKASFYKNFTAKYENCSSDDDIIDIRTLKVVKKRKKPRRTELGDFSYNGSWNDTGLLAIIWDQIEGNKTDGAMNLGEDRDICSDKDTCADDEGDSDDYEYPNCNAEELDKELRLKNNSTLSKDAIVYESTPTKRTPTPRVTDNKRNAETKISNEASNINNYSTTNGKDPSSTHREERPDFAENTKRKCKHSFESPKEVKRRRFEDLCSSDRTEEIKVPLNTPRNNARNIKPRSLNAMVTSSSKQLFDNIPIASECQSPYRLLKHSVNSPRSLLTPSPYRKKRIASLIVNTPVDFIWCTSPRFNNRLVHNESTTR